MFDSSTSTEFFAPSGLEALRAGRPRRPRIKIRISKFEISNKPKYSNFNFEIQNDLGKHPKSEYRNTKQFQNLNSQNPKPSNENFSRVFKCFEISILSFPFLFRVSDFEFRICNFICAWRPLRLCPSIPLGVLRFSKDASYLFFLLAAS